MRTRQEIDTEYTQLAALVGDMTYKMGKLGAQLQSLVGKMEVLSQEEAAPAEEKTTD